ncbi:uncharacterized protein LOC106169907 isoform X2 [Lingula anatina]|uniref:Uncharacterized protein LOC106169907 isoform X2 n=1 Tax=Lingula anatina TaxID=7574 RepID=A0A1S3J3P4_LINAN|nr:uncharacterized protein LOC106169907 isoform X2 [Lingula anatina]|eukprot:XP_013405020.1 uncharacterized protein LOC106169907 isoform X2 [Lingula anatina]
MRSITTGMSPVPLAQGIGRACQAFAFDCYDEVTRYLGDSEEEFCSYTDMSEINGSGSENADKLFHHPDSAVGFLTPINHSIHRREILVEAGEEDEDDDCDESEQEDHGSAEGFDQPDVGFLAPLDRKKDLYQNPKPQEGAVVDLEKECCRSIREKFPLPATVLEIHQTLDSLVLHRENWLPDLRDFFTCAKNESEFYHVALTLAEMLVDAVHKLSVEPMKVHSLRLRQKPFSPTLFNCWQKLVDGLGFIYEGPNAYVKMEYCQVHTREKQKKSEVKACLALISAITELGYMNSYCLVKKFSKQHAGLYMELVKKLDSEKVEPTTDIKTLWKSHKELLKCLGFGKEKQKGIFYHESQYTGKMHVAYLILHSVHGEPKVLRTDSKKVIKETSM